MSLSGQQRRRYDRNLIIPGFGEAAQERLLQSRVLIVGLGGLGSPAALYLAAAGIGELGLLDSDAVELSNLQRQVLHATARIGQDKAASAAETILALDPEIRVVPMVARLTPENGRQLLAGYDAVVEATDNFETKFLVNDLCVELGIPFATAGILAMSGQALFVVPGASPCLRCAIPEPPRTVPTTAELGVLGAVPGILGSVEAMEVIRYLAGLWTSSDGRGALHSIDGDAMRLNTLRIPRRANCRCAFLWSST